MSRLFRCKLQRTDGVRVTYIGPFEGWSSEWHLVMRVVAVRGRAA